MRENVQSDTMERLTNGGSRCILKETKGVPAVRELKDPALLEKYLEKFRIRSLFDTEELPFRLVEYAQGEQINLLHPPEQFLKFLVEGTLCIYSINGEGDRYVYGRIDRPCMIGEMEFCGKRYESHWHEAVTRLRCIELYVEPLRERLWQDNRFLRLMLNVFAEERYRSTVHGRDEDYACRDKLLNYLRHAAPNHTLTGVEQAAERFHCSSRQLLRELKVLTESGQVEKLGRGKYRLRLDG